MRCVHIIGAGLAGLAAALKLSAQPDCRVTLYEATQRAGGRCRSFHDDLLGCDIDNGNHLIMGGNRAAMAYMDEIGARDRLAGPAETRFDFVDIPTGERWSIRPNRGIVPWWVLARSRRVPGTSLFSYLPALKLLFAGDEFTVDEVIDRHSVLYTRMLEPLTVAAINAAPSDAAVALLRPVLLETFGRGAKGCHPLIARHSLADTLIDPALTVLANRAVETRFGMRLQKIGFDGDRAASLDFGGEQVALGADDAMILAAPAWEATSLLPELTAPPPGDPIVNVHFRTEGTTREVAMTGLIGGFAHWIFTRDDIISITISAAVEEARLDAEEIARRCWSDVQVALCITAEMPPHRVIKERRATIGQSPSAVRMRPKAATAHPNLFLAGDWTDTGLPATIEAAIRSGNHAAALASGKKH